MDTALALRLALEKGEKLAAGEIREMLAASPLVEKCTADFQPHPLFTTFRLMALGEIPHSEELDYTRKLLVYSDENIATEEGFAPLGGVAEIVPCYNAMLLEAYCRLGRGNSPQARAALCWIKSYQLFARGEKSPWPYKGVCKHGGCLGSVPCYIGIGKTVRALLAHREFGPGDGERDALLERGMDYMLSHGMYRRLSDGRPISPHITDIMMAQSYHLSLTDLVYILGKGGLVREEGAAPLLATLAEKKAKGGGWKIDYLYNYRGYVAFEGRRKPSEWISALFPLWLGEKENRAQ